MPAKKKKPAPRPTPTRKAASKAAGGKKPTARPLQAKSGGTSLFDGKPGWLSRVFGVETGSLIACDAKWDGGDWQRGDSFRFLYRSRRGMFFLLTDSHHWSILPDSEARTTYQQLPQKLLPPEEALAAGAAEPLPARSGGDDGRTYRVVRNDKWEFSIWLDHQDLPPGWQSIGVSGARGDCLEFIARNTVFGAPNPGIP